MSKVTYAAQIKVLLSFYEGLAVEKVIEVTILCVYKDLV